MNLSQDTGSYAMSSNLLENRGGIAHGPAERDAIHRENFLKIEWVAGSFSETRRDERPKRQWPMNDFWGLQHFLKPR
jgi:hypothetical protein